MKFALGLISVALVLSSCTNSLIEDVQPDLSLTDTGATTTGLVYTQAVLSIEELGREMSLLKNRHSAELLEYSNGEMTLADLMTVLGDSDFVNSAACDDNIGIVAAYLAYNNKMKDELREKFQLAFKGMDYEIGTVPNLNDFPTVCAQEWTLNNMLLFNTHADDMMSAIMSETDALLHAVVCTATRAQGDIVNNSTLENCDG